MSQGEVTYFVGSPFWMPPEMIKYDYHGLPADIWSFGVVIMEVANDERPYGQNFFKAMFVAGTRGYPNPFNHPEDWSSNFNEFLNSCLIMDPKERWTTSQLLKHKFIKSAVSKKSFKGAIRSLVDIDEN